MTAEVFEESIAAFFGEMLVARGFRLFSEEATPKSFGNQSVVYASPALAVRFVRDRGEAFVHVAARPELPWQMLPRLLEYLKLDRESSFWSWDERALKRQGAALARHFDQIAAALQSEGETAAKLDEFSTAKADEHYRKLGLKKL
jgi:hypothetical protein